MSERANRQRHQQVQSQDRDICYLLARLLIRPSFPGRALALTKGEEQGGEGGGWEAAPPPDCTQQPSKTPPPPPRPGLLLALHSEQSLGQEACTAMQ